MNREIKFRAKRKLNGEWVYGSFVKGESEDCDFIVGIPDDSLDEVRISVITNTVGQFTGLKDKNGVEIYEGDILKSKVGITYSVLFKNGAYRWGNDNDNDLLIENGDDITDDCINWGEVIGNIHENPELLNSN